MKRLLQVLSILLFSITLWGCAIIISHDDVKRDCFYEEQHMSMCDEFIAEASEEMGDDSTIGFNPSVNYQTIDEYTEQIVAELIKASAHHVFDRPIAIPPFMSLMTDQIYNHKLALELPESIIATMRSEHLFVAEYKLTPPLPANDQPYEEIIGELKDSQKFGYVLKGTIRSNPHGATVVVRIINIETNAVIASTSKHLPEYILVHHS